MTVEQLARLSIAAWHLHSYSETLAATFDTPVNVPDHFETLSDWREHLSCMCGHYRMEIGRLYNNVDGWQDI
jgi:hypothetical protein